MFPPSFIKIFKDLTLLDLGIEERHLIVNIFLWSTIVKHKPHMLINYANL
jgi:hypothetical protein